MTIKEIAELQKNSVASQISAHIEFLNTQVPERDPLGNDIITQDEIDGLKNYWKAKLEDLSK